MGVKRINISILRRGDIILTTTPVKMTSGLIRGITRSDISHAMLCVSFGSVVDSTNEGVASRNIQKLLYDEASPLYVLRLQDSPPESLVEKLVNYARSLVGTRYSLIEAAASSIPESWKQSGKRASKRQFCSRLVAQAYASAGVSIVKNPDYCTPDDIKQSELLKQVENAVLLMSVEEVRAIEDAFDATKIMRERTSRLLNELRVLDSTIENLNDLNGVLLSKPALDKEIAAIIRSSGYLSIFEDYEVARFPWRYDPVEIARYYQSLEDPADLVEYCRIVVDWDEVDFAHWEITQASYERNYELCGLETFKILAELYSNLNYFRKLRAVSASVVLWLHEHRVGAKKTRLEKPEPAK